jgi:predicted transcriptional regulator
MINFTKIQPVLQISLLGDKNLTDKEYRILTYINFCILQNTYISNKMIADICNIRYTEASRYVNILIKKGYIISKLENNNVRTLSLPPSVDKAPYSTNVDYQTFKKTVIDILSKNRTQLGITAEQAGLQGIYKKDTEFTIKRDKNDNYRVFNEFCGNYLIASDAAIFWKEFWLSKKNKYQEFFKKLEQSCNNG